MALSEHAGDVGEARPRALEARHREKKDIAEEHQQAAAKEPGAPTTQRVCVRSESPPTIGSAIMSQNFGSEDPERRQRRRNPQRVRHEEQQQHAGRARINPGAKRSDAVAEQHTPTQPMSAWLGHGGTVHLTTALSGRDVSWGSASKPADCRAVIEPNTNACIAALSNNRSTVPVIAMS